MTTRELKFPSLATLGRMPAQVFLVIALVVLLIIFAILAPNFLTVSNILNVLRHASPLFMLATGQTLVILLAGIDLSQGSLVGFVSVMTGLAMMQFGSIPAGIVVGLLTGATVGFVSSLLITKAKVQPFIVSLGFLFSIYGLTFSITGGNRIVGLPELFFVVGGGMVGGVIPVPVIIFAVVAFALHQVLRRTPFGRNIYAVGGNQEAARLSGVGIDRTKIFAWALNGFLVALGSIILTSRVGSGEPWMGGFDMLLESIAAAVIGGTSLFGGKGGIGGTIVGVLIIAFLVNGLTLMGMNQFVREITVGLLIILAVWFGFRGR